MLRAMSASDVKFCLNGILFHIVFNLNSFFVTEKVLPTTMSVEITVYIILTKLTNTWD